MKTQSKTSRRLELLCSTAGTGKTQHCIQLFRAATLESPHPLSRSSFFILPNKEHTDRITDLLLKRLPHEKEAPRGLLAPAILTINDFIRQRVGATVQKTPGDVLKKILIASVLEELEDPERPAGSGLEYFRNVRANRGFHDLVADFLREAKSGFLVSAGFEERAAPLFRKHPVFGKKLRDLLRVFKAYDEKLTACGLEDADDLIMRFVHGVERNAWKADLDLVIFDGFYRFTRAQLEFIRAISRSARHVLVTLTLDAGEERSHVFEYPAATRAALLQMGFQEAGAAGKVNRRAAEPALAHLEEQLFRPEPAPFGKAQEAVQIFEATGMSGEIEMIAREIRRLYREQNLHFSDFCVLLRGIGPYEEVIRSVFAAFDVPVAIHERKKLKQNPFIRSFMKWIDVIRNGWERQDLFDLLESGYCGFPEEAVRRLEVLSLEAGILEGEQAWRDFAAALTGKEKEILDGLFAAKDALLAGRSPRAFKKNLLRFISERRMIYRLRPDDGDLEPTREDFQAFRSLEKIMDEIILHNDLKGKAPLEFSQYTKHLTEAVEIALFSLPPLGKNRVQVYDISFGLQKEYKVIFTAGLLEQNFPQRVLEEALLKDEERRLLNGADECFPERLKRISGERYFFYMAVTRARSRLYLTCPRYDLEGKEALPSFYLEEVRKCLGGGNVRTREKDIGDVIPLPAEICEREDLFRILTHGLFSPDAAPDRFYGRLLNLCLSGPEYPAVLARIFREEETAKLEDPEILERLRARQRAYSATTLEPYATCPFKFFAEKTLRLQETREAINPLLLGSIRHKALENFYARTRVENKRDWIMLKDKEAARKILLEELDKVLAMPEFALRGARKFQIDLEKQRLADQMSEFVEEENAAEAERTTLPRHFEERFEEKRFSGFSGVLLKGAIDRIDVDPEKNLAVVVDYKSKKKRAEDVIKNLEKGVELQLPIYIAAVRAMGYTVAGAEFYALEEPKNRKGFYRRDLIAQVGLDAARSQRYLSPEEFDEAVAAAGKKIDEYVAEIENGRISIHSKGCDHCKYGTLCRFEKWKLIYLEIPKAWTRKKN